MAKAKKEEKKQAVEPLTVSWKNKDGNEEVQQWDDPGFFVAWCIKVARISDSSDTNPLEKVKKIFSDTEKVFAMFQDEHLQEYSKEYNSVYELWQFCYEHAYR